MFIPLRDGHLTAVRCVALIRVHGTVYGVSDREEKPAPDEGRPCCRHRGLKPLSLRADCSFWIAAHISSASTPPSCRLPRRWQSSKPVRLTNCARACPCSGGSSRETFFIGRLPDLGRAPGKPRRAP